MAILTSGYTGSKARHVQMVEEKVESEVWDIFEGLDEPLFDVDVAAVAESFFGFASKPVLNPAYSIAPVVFSDPCSLHTFEWEVY